MAPKIHDSASQSSVKNMADSGGHNSGGFRRVGRHYGLLLWKNFLLAKRMPVRTFFEIILPVFFGFLLLGIRHIVKSETLTANTIFPAFSIDKLPKFDTMTVSELAFSPNTTFTRAVVTRAAAQLGLYVQAFKDEDTLVDAVNKDMPQSIFLGGIVFTNLDIQSNITYKIRLAAKLRNSGSGGIFSGENNWRTNLLYPVFPIVGPRNRNSSSGGTPGYYREGFLTLQRAIDMEILNELNPTFNSSNIHIQLQRYPYPPYKADNFVLVIQIWFPFLLVMSYIFAAINTVKNIVYEKENGLKVAMTIMGLSSWIHWVSWFTRSLIFLLIADILIAVCYIVKIPLKSGGSSSVIGESDITLVFFFLFTYSITSICFMFLISTLFDKANSAAAGTGGLWFLSYLPYAFIQPRYETMTRGSKMATCLLHNIGLALGAQLIGMFEGKGTGLQWSMFNEPVSVDDNFTMADVTIMLYIDALIYLLLALYIENIWPGQYGIPKSVFYPFQLSYWRGYVKSNVHQVTGATNEQNQERAMNSDAFEDEPTDKELGVQLNNVSKTYSFLFNTRPDVHAVQDLSMNIYSGQLTALLGHNGAGKSTTISMITGLIPPTRGQIIVNGFDIGTSMDSVRNILGLCPQYNILFDHLTVREHLRLFATLKGHPANDINNEITRMVTDLMLQDKLDTLSSALSGGMKRKLSVGIALIANSKVVILDEPTSGMDPAARRSTWDMLKRFRHDRTILFTTHFMDEADILGDRIAIMGGGRARCCGSSFFLKTKYGVGYHLILSKDTSSDVARIMQLVRNHIDQAQLESDISAECKILLPHGSSNKLPVLFDDLERNKAALQIFSIGLSETSIEEVFMKIVEEDEPDEIVTTHGQHLHNNAYEDGEINEQLSQPTDGLRESTAEMKTNSPNSKLSIFDTEIIKNTGIDLMFQQFRALLLKRMINSMRNYLVLICALLPFLFVIISLIIEQQIPKPEDSPALLMSLNRYQQGNVPYTYQRNDNLTVNFIRAYETVLQQSSKSPALIDLTTNQTRPCHDDETTDIVTYLACIGHRSILELSDRYLIGANVRLNSSEETLNITGLFNNQPYHVPSLSLNYITNALLKQYASTTMSNSTIHVVNHPLPRSLTEAITDFQSQQFFGFRMASSIVFGFGFLMAAFAVFLIKERVSKAKHLQFLSGANGFNFWLSTFLWDFVYYIISVGLILLIWTIFYYAGGSVKNDLKVYLTGNRFGYTVLLYLLYGLSQIPMTYLLSYLFQISASGFAWITIINIITSQATLLAIVILSIPQLELLDVANVLEWIFLLIFPNYCLGQGLNDIYQNSFLNELCEPLVPLCAFVPNPCCKDTCGSNCVSWTPDYLSWEKPGIGRFVTFMSIQSFVIFTILLLNDYQIFSKLGYFICCGFRSNRNYNNLQNTTNHTISTIIPITSTTDIGNTPEDEDVKVEAERIQTTSYFELMLTDVLVLNQVEKIYNGVFHAVDQLSVGVKHSECFGLLGVNGAGKTTTFKMITGDETVDGGSIILDGINLSTNMRSAQQRMGYCPQFDALLDLLTGEETLYMFSRLRGVKEYLIPRIVNSLVDLMNLRKHAKKPIYAYSGGNKRKLSAAVALIGDPAIVFLDEPTTGMDPKARRHFWNAIAQFRDHGKPIILTSHSMEECEALCTRLAIMVNGKFKCLGSIQHLKSRFGAGYTLKAKLNVFDNDLVNGFYSVINNAFRNSKKEETHEGFVQIHINEPDLSLATLFRVIESCKQTYSIENYTVSQTTLEEVFLTFARSQLDPDELRRRIRTEHSWTSRLTRCC